MIEINSAILEENFAKLEAKLKRGSGLIDFAQIDICDGKYVPSKTFLSTADLKETEQLANITQDAPLELDMMVDWSINADWLKVFEILKPQRIVLHHTSITDEHLDMVFDTLDPTRTEFGLGIHLDDKLDEMMARFDAYPFTYVQIMGIEKVGYSGQAQSDKLIPYIKAFKTLRPDTPISIDGGVKRENIKALKEAGATRMTLGSGLFSADDIKQRVKDLRNEVA